MSNCVHCGSGNCAGGDFCHTYDVRDESYTSQKEPSYRVKKVDTVNNNLVALLASSDDEVICIYKDMELNKLIWVDRLNPYTNGLEFKPTAIFRSTAWDIAIKCANVI
jgi:hypothetical protein|tara:strand:+ start:6042 stop:6365 length:324 start_codon:yes stop_codon:yes gene_type:complete